MNAVEVVKGFLASRVYDQLCDEADHNVNAIELLEMLNISIASLVFFQENNIQHRVNSELKALYKTIHYITEIYEEQK